MYYIASFVTNQLNFDLQDRMRAKKNPFNTFYLASVDFVKKTVEKKMRQLLFGLKVQALYEQTELILKKKSDLFHHLEPVGSSVTVF